MSAEEPELAKEPTFLGSMSTTGYYQSYRSIVHPLSPLIDSEPLELMIANHLEGDSILTAGVSSSAIIAFLFAVLASGAQYSDLGLHDAENMQSLFIEERRMRSQLWKVILQHDSILSLSFDRPTSLPALPVLCFLSSAPAQVLRYPQLMWGISQLCAGSLMHRPREADLAKAHQRLQEVDDLAAQATDHLRNKNPCRSMHGRLEYFTVNLHVTFMVSVICRPVFFNSNQHHDQQSMNLKIRGRTALTDTVRHFLSLHRLTTYAIRTWTTYHEALSSSLLLELMHEADINTEVREMQSEFLEAFIVTLDVDSEDNSSLSAPHTRAIDALRRVAQIGNSNGMMQAASDRGILSSLTDVVPADPGQNILDSFNSILWDTDPTFDDQFWIGMNGDFLG
ncbi:hypothetical protein EK21DRAFT_89462 [Setomelanomma holmii]|uniref:Transcription factor domain-containing protein n=1 Tax=Setomelanomma holmii TaxID=210430 RepID=A0A9P4H836_9PLEO|nr:hypothetical protein EK21DRAFT_89462 [Setomelanomma holmii]